MVRCGNCGYVTTRRDEQEEGKANYCSGCGYCLGGRKCLSCGTLNALNAKVCKSCGRSKLSYGAAALPLSCLVPAILLTVITGLVTGLWASGIPQKVGTYLHDAALSSPTVLGLLQWVYLFMGLLMLGSVFYPILPKPAQRVVAAFYRFVAQAIVWLLSAISGRLARKS